MEIVLRIKDHQNHWPCSQCGNEARQVINHAPMLVIPEHMRWNAQSYESPTTGAHITTKKQRIEDMARSGCIEYDPGMKQDADRRVKEQDAALDKAIEATVEREFEAMPTAKKERLCNELTAGAEAEYTRLTA
jgi:hypothetical protein